MNYLSNNVLINSDILTLIIEDKDSEIREFKDLIMIRHLFLLNCWNWSQYFLYLTDSWNDIKVSVIGGSLSAGWIPVMFVKHCFKCFKGKHFQLKCRHT